MKNLLLILPLILLVNLLAQQLQYEIAPNAIINTNSAIIRDSFNLQFSFPCNAYIGEYGIESDGVNIYVTQWLGDSIAKYDQAGNVLERFVIPGVAMVRDLACDGQYNY